ncbi:MAG: hypothetical protein ACJ8AI_32860 [Rhodopila sp.]
MPPTPNRRRPAALPPDVEKLCASCPPMLDRHGAARVISQHFFQISPRTLQSWPLATVRLNGRAHAETRAWLEHAAQMMRDAAA